MIVNEQGGTASRLGQKLVPDITSAFAEAGLGAKVVTVSADAVADAVKAEAGPLVVVGGGDGTLGTAAGVLSDSSQVLGILPLGTRNHLARELGLPMDLPGAALAIANGAVRKIDLGCAGDRVFVNNCSVGIYARLVRARERRRLPKWLATIPAAIEVMKGLGQQHFRLEWGGAEHRIESPLLFIGNNRYSLEAGHLGERRSLSDGVLSIAAVEAAGPMALARMALRLVLGRADLQRDFAALKDVAEAIVHDHRRRDVAVDGEVVAMQFPLRLTVLPGALQVIALAQENPQPT